MADGEDSIFDRALPLLPHLPHLSVTLLQQETSALATVLLVALQLVQTVA